MNADEVTLLYFAFISVWESFYVNTERFIVYKICSRQDKKRFIFHFETELIYLFPEKIFLNEKTLTKPLFKHDKARADNDIHVSSVLFISKFKTFSLYSLINFLVLLSINLQYTYLYTTGDENSTKWLMIISGAAACFATLILLSSHFRLFVCARAILYEGVVYCCESPGGERHFNLPGVSWGSMGFKLMLLNSSSIIVTKQRMMKALTRKKRSIFAYDFFYVLTYKCAKI